MKMNHLAEPDDFDLEIQLSRIDEEDSKNEVSDRSLKVI